MDVLCFADDTDAELQEMTDRSPRLASWYCTDSAIPKAKTRPASLPSGFANGNTTMGIGAALD